MLPKMHKRWMHRELDREVVMQLEKPPRMMGLGIRPEKSSGDRSFGYFFFFTIYALGLMRIVVVVDATSAFCAQHSAVIDSINRVCPPAQHLPCEASSPTPERVMVQVQANVDASTYDGVL